MVTQRRDNCRGDLAIGFQVCLPDDSGCREKSNSRKVQNLANTSRGTTRTNPWVKWSFRLAACRTSPARPNTSRRGSLICRSDLFTTAAQTENLMVLTDCDKRVTTRIGILVQCTIGNASTRACAPHVPALRRAAGYSAGS